MYIYRLYPFWYLLFGCCGILLLSAQENQIHTENDQQRTVIVQPRRRQNYGEQVLEKLWALNTCAINTIRETIVNHPETILAFASYAYAGITSYATKQKTKEYFSGR